MESETVKINGCVDVTFIPLDKLKTTVFGVYIHTPLTEERVSMNAVLPYVLKRGSRLCPDMEQAEKYLERLYGASFSCGVSKRGNDNMLLFDGEVISDEYAPSKEPLTMKMLDFMTAAVFEPVTDGDGFLAEYVYSEKKNARDRALAAKNDKASYAADKMTEHMLGDDPAALPRLGRAEDIEKITASALYSYYKQMITSSPIDIFICGKCDREAVTGHLRSYFKAFGFKNADMPPVTLAKPKSGTETVFEYDDVTQGKLVIGFTTDTSPESPDYAALMTANSIFGGGAHSKLFRNVREKLSLAYYAYSVMDKHKGVIKVNAGIEFDKYDAALGEIEAQLKALQRGEISDSELEAAKASVTDDLNSYYDDGRYLESFYISQKAAGVSLTVEQLKEQIAAVTKEDAVRAAKRIKPDTVYFLKGRGER